MKLAARIVSLAAVVNLIVAETSLSAAEPAFNWERVTEGAPWQPRDSSGEVVFNDHLWLMGGWYDSMKPYPRDVWKSADGRKWARVTDQAGWTSADLPMTCAFDGRIWFMGGWFNGRLPGARPTNEIWSSRDGATWERTETTTCWSPRFAAGTAVFKGRMWILEGWSTTSPARRRISATMSGRPPTAGRGCSRRNMPAGLLAPITAWLCSRTSSG